MTNIYHSRMIRSLFRHSVFDRVVCRREARTPRQWTAGACRRRTQSTPDGTCDREPYAPSPSDLELVDT